MKKEFIWEVIINLAFITLVLMEKIKNHSFTLYNALYKRRAIYKKNFTIGDEKWNTDIYAEQSGLITVNVIMGGKNEDSYRIESKCRQWRD